MKQTGVLLLLFLLVPTSAFGAQPPLNISLARSNAPEVHTRTQLERLAATYDLSPWLFNRAIVIDSEAIPHSHPVLTLHTRHLKDDDLLLSTFVHEQLHWFLESKPKETEAAIRDLKSMFPSIPTGYPQASSDEHGNYVHLIVALLEHRANQQLLGELRARQVMNFWANDHYTWIYRAVLDRGKEISHVVRQNHLLPVAAQPKAFRSAE